MSVAPEDNKLKNVSPGSQVSHRAFFSPKPTKQSVVLVMFCRPIGCFRFLETEKSRRKQISFNGQKLQLMQHPKTPSSLKTLTSKL